MSVVKLRAMTSDSIYFCLRVVRTRPVSLIRFVFFSRVHLYTPVHTCTLLSAINTAQLPTECVRAESDNISRRTRSCPSFVWRTVQHSADGWCLVPLARSLLADHRWSHAGCRGDSPVQTDETASERMPWRNTNSLIELYMCAHVNEKLLSQLSLFLGGDPGRVRGSETQRFGPSRF